MTIVVGPEAEAELEQAAEFYRLRQTDLDEEFLAEIAAAFDRIVQFPHSAPAVGRGARRLVLSRFPYVIVYRVQGEQIRIYAVAHQKRRPGYWRKRLTR